MYCSIHGTKGKCHIFLFPRKSSFMSNFWANINVWIKKLGKYECMNKKRFYFQVLFFQPQKLNEWKTGAGKKRHQLFLKKWGKSSNANEWRMKFSWEIKNNKLLYFLFCFRSATKKKNASWFWSEWLMNFSEEIKRYGTLPLKSLKFN